MISVNNLSIHFTGTDLFNNVSFQVRERDRVGLVGKNGSGKTTLLNIITRRTRPQQGDVIIPTGMTMGYLRQEMETGSRKPLLEEALGAFDEVLALEKKLHRLNGQIAERTDYDSPDYERLIHDLTETNERLHILGAESMEGETEKVLMGLGFVREDFSRPVSEFSSGWQMRVELARILLRKPDLILLDEPTNHLDIESIQWLEEFLSDYFGAVILVSHDRAFLDNVTERTVEIELGKIYDYKASYSGYVQMREERLARQIAAYNNQQNQVRQIERFIERFRYKNTKARQVQSKIKMLDKMDTIEIETIDQSAIRFRFPPAPRAGKVIIEAQHLGKKYGEKEVLRNLDFALINGDRVAFVGKNGEGKTTLSRVIIGELEYEGNLKFGHNIRIGYFAQNQADYLDPDKTVFETIDDVATGEMRKQVRTLLGSFLFSGDTIDKKVKVLSGGEKSRLSLAKLLLTPSNLLVLDEPTNHLDMQSKDILKNALLQYDGTLIVVSHDRDFLQGLTNKVFEFRNKTIREHLGDVYDFLDYRRLKHLKELESGDKKKVAAEETVTENKKQYEEKKQRERDIRKIQSMISNSEEKISVLEGKIAAANQQLAEPAKDLDFDKLSKNLYRYDHQLKEEMDRWEKLNNELERLRK